MNLLRRLASLPVLRSVLLHPRVRRLLAGILALRFLVAASVADQPVRLLWNELTARGQIRRYRIRRTGVPFLMLHGRDLEALFELFWRGEYEPPPSLAARLVEVDRVVDIGANVGMFSAWARGRWPAAELIAFEPDPENLAIYREWLEAQVGPVQLVEAAAAPSAGLLPFRSGLGGGSQSVSVGQANIHVPTVDVFSFVAGAQFIKMDIEGGEWPILADPRLAELREVILVMEFHRVGAPSLPAAEAALSLLQAAGFEVGHIRRNHWGHGVLWAWKD